MAKYILMATGKNTASICKDGECFDGCDTSSVDQTWRAVQWDGSTGIVELCDGLDIDKNIGEQELTSESDIQAIISAWDVAKSAHEAALQAMADANQAAIDSGEAGVEVLNPA